MPYGFPSGAQLRKTLCHPGNINDISKFLTSRGMAVASDLSTFCDTFRLSAQVSIDTFLSKRPEFSDIGKLCIATDLCAKEHTEYLTRLENDDHWHLTLWNQLQDDAHAAQQIPDNQVRFVTFNYERSLECFLFNALCGSFPVTSEEALEILTKIPIIHVYGKLGKFGLVAGSDTRPYIPTLTEESVRVAANSIKVIPDARADDTDFMMVRHWIDWADQICFLGFAFDPLNMERLGLQFSSVPKFLRKEDERSISVVASTYGLTGAETSRIQDKYFNETFTPIPHQCLMVLRESGILG